MSRLARILNIKPITMHHKILEFPFDSSHSGSWINIIFLHSLLSSSLTAFSIPFFVEPLSITLSIALNRNIRCYLLDTRNHGFSPHSNTFCLESMCVDLHDFIEQDNTLKNQSNPLFLCGHSMGGKVSLLYSLLCGANITGIIALDASPSTYYHNHQRIFDAMKNINFANVNKKYNVDNDLRENGIIDGSERGFIMDNLIHSNNNQWKWKCNLNIISDNEHYIHSFPDSKYMSIYDKYTLFLGGNINSDRLTNPKYIQDLNFWFPNNSIKLFDGGHFIHRTHYKQIQHEILQYLKIMLPLNS